MSKCIYKYCKGAPLASNRAQPETSPGFKPCFQLFIQPLTRPFRYVCIRGVFILTTECTSLTVTLVVTLRKFLSLIFSILYFQNPFTTWHWVGTAVVFLGTLLYTEVWTSVGAALGRPDAKEKKAA